MRRFSIFVILLIGFFGRSVEAARPTVPRLHVGDLFPQFSGQTLSGKLLTLPVAGSDKSAVLIFSFSRNAAKDARLWNRRVSADFSDTLPAYAILLLQSAPRLFRGMAVSNIKSSMPHSVQARTIVLYQDEELWKQRLAVTDKSRVYAILLGPDCRIRWVNSGAFTEPEYARLKRVAKISHVAQTTGH